MKRRRRADAGVVDQDVAAPKLLQGPFRQVPDLLFACYIRCYAEGAAAQRLNLSGRLFDRSRQTRRRAFSGTSADDNIGAGACKLNANRPANPAAGAGDDRDLALQWVFPS